MKSMYSPTGWENPVESTSKPYAKLPKAAYIEFDGREETSWFTAEQVLAFADRTHALRTASHGQAPTQPVMWPTMPPSRGQSPVLFEDGYAEGWAKCLQSIQDLFAATPSPQAAQVEDSVKELLNLIDTFAELRHTQGHWTYNTKSQEARNAVIAALKGE